MLVRCQRLYGVCTVNVESTSGTHSGGGRGVDPYMEVEIRTCAVHAIVERLRAIACEYMDVLRPHVPSILRTPHRYCMYSTVHVHAPPSIPRPLVTFRLLATTSTLPAHLHLRLRTALILCSTLPVTIHLARHAVYCSSAAYPFHI